MESEALDLFSEVDHISPKTKAPAAVNPNKRKLESTGPSHIEVKKALEDFHSITLKIGAKKDQRGIDDLNVVEVSLRQNAYYKFWAAVAGMLDHPLNRVFFLLDDKHYELVQTGFDANVKRLNKIRDDRAKIHASQEERTKRVQKLIPSIDIVLRTQGGIALYARAIARVDELLKSYNAERKKKVYLDALETYAMPIQVFNSNNGDVYTKLAETARILAIETDDRRMLGVLSGPDVNDAMFIRFVIYIGWTLLENYAYFWEGAEIPNLYPREYDNITQFPRKLNSLDIVLSLQISAARDEVIREVRAKIGTKEEQLDRVLRNARVYVNMAENRPLFSSTFTFAESAEPQEPGDDTSEAESPDISLLEGGSSSLDDEGAKLNPENDDDLISGLQLWLQRVTTTTVVDTKTAADRFETITSLIEEITDDFMAEEALIAETVRLRKGLTVEVEKDEELVIRNEFMTAFTQAYDQIRTTSPAFSFWKRSTFPTTWLMLDKRIYPIVARMTGLYYLQHIRLYQPKSWTPVRTNTDIGKDIMEMLRQINSILGTARFSLKK